MNDRLRVLVLAAAIGLGVYAVVWALVAASRRIGLLDWIVR